MAPNIPLGAVFRESDENSREDFDKIEPLIFDLVPRVRLPKLFQPRLPPSFQAADTPTNTEDIKNVAPSRTVEVPPPNLPLRPSNPRATIQDEQEVSRFLDEIFVNENFDRNSRRRFNAQGPTKDIQESPSIMVDTILPPRPVELPIASNNPARQPAVSNNPPTVSQVPATHIPGRVPPGATQQSTKDIPALESGVTTTPVLRSKRPRPSSTTPRPFLVTTSKSTTLNLADSGVLKIPGHEPEAPADLNLIHHDRAIDTRNQTGLSGIFVKDESTSLTTEAATALILIGLCSVFLVFICFIMFVQKIKRQRLDRKVVQDTNDMKSRPMYEATTTTYQPNPLSFLPPDILHALMQPIASKAEHFEEPKPSFITMEPPQPGNQLGCLWFSVYYDYVNTTLVLHILHARYMKGRGSSTNPGNVWVEACILTPMNTIKASNKTDTRRASLAPVFNQNFTFKLEDEEVTQFLLRLTLYDNHPLNGEKAVGSVIVPLSTVDLCSSATISRDLQ